MTTGATIWTTTHAPDVSNAARAGGFRRPLCYRSRKPATRERIAALPSAVRVSWAARSWTCPACKLLLSPAMRTAIRNAKNPPLPLKDIR